MTIEQMTDIVLKQTSEIAALAESVKSAHRRIDENDRITDGIHKLAANVEALALQVKLLTESMENSIARIESSLKSQGERIGAVETACIAIERYEQDIAALGGKIDAIEKEPAARWKDIVKQVTALVVAAVIGVFTGKLTK